MSNLTSYSPDLGRMVGPFSDPADDALGRVYNANGVVVGGAELWKSIPKALRAHSGLLAQADDGTWSAA